jgi:hypothetical protein
VAIGVLASLPMYFLYQFVRLEEIKGAIAASSVIAMGAVIAFLIVIAGSVWLFRRVAGKNPPSLQSVVTSAKEAAQAALKKDADRAIDHLHDALADIAAVYGFVSLRIWVGTIALGCLALFAGTVTTLLLMQQNGILEKQDQKLGEQLEAIRAQNDLLKLQARQSQAQSFLVREQNALIEYQILAGEAQRRIPLFSQLSDVLADVRAEAVAAAEKEDAGIRGPDRPFFSEDRMLVASAELTSRIRNVARLMRPYSYPVGRPAAVKAPPPEPDDDGFIDPDFFVRESNTSDALAFKFGSEERGQILQALTTYRVDPSLIVDMDFSHADLSDARIILDRHRLPFCQDPLANTANPGVYALGRAERQGFIDNAEFDGGVVDLRNASFDRSRIVNLKLDFDANKDGMSFVNADLENVIWEMDNRGAVVDLSGARIDNLLLAEGWRSNTTFVIEGAEIGRVCFLSAIAIETGDLSLGAQDARPREWGFQFQTSFTVVKGGLRRDPDMVRRFLTTELGMAEQEVDELTITDTGDSFLVEAL